MAPKKLPKKLYVGTFGEDDTASYNTILIPDADIPLEEAKLICLKCTAPFEGAWKNNDFDYGVIGINFDMAGLSQGIIQWNIWSRNLFALWKSMYDKNQDKFKECYEGGDPERFKPHFANAPAILPADVWKTSEFIKFLSTTDRKAHFAWSKCLHKPNAITSYVPPPNSPPPVPPQDWITKPGFNAATALQPELVDFCKRHGEVPEFQEIQRETAWRNYGTIAIKDVKWLRQACQDNYPDLMQKIELRTLAACFDVAVQQGGFPYARNNNKVVKKIEQRIANETFTSQNDILKMAVLEKAYDAKNIYVVTCASRRLGFVNAHSTYFVLTPEATYGKGKEITNPNFKLVSDNPFVDGI